MKKETFAFGLLPLTILLTSCTAIGGIFKAGVWSGIILVAVIIAIILFIVSKVSGKK